MKFKSLIVALFATVACTNAWAWDLSSLKNINLGSVVNSLVSTDKVEISAPMEVGGSGYCVQKRKLVAESRRNSC